jgi:ethanolamine phosphate phosphodiesterase
MANQIRRPGFQLLSLVTPPVPPAPPSGQTLADTPCFLPDQYNIYTSVYTPFFSLTVLLLFFITVYHVRHFRALPPTPISLSPHNTRLTNTLLHPESAIWSPHTPLASPITQKSSSPRTGAFPSLRTPNASAVPALRALSRPSTPASPLISPMIVSHDDEDEESMYPPQYAVRRDVQSLSNGNTWAAEHRETIRDTGYGDYGRTSSYFLPAPRLRNVDVQHWSWSWSVNVRGRRLTVRFPGFFSFTFWKSLFISGVDSSDGFSGKRWRVLKGTISDLLAVAWLPVIVWVAIARWMF